MKEFPPRSSYTNFEDAIFCTSKVIANVKVVRTEKRRNRETGQKQYVPALLETGHKKTRHEFFTELCELLSYILT